ncbi:hypothetical protein CCP4SC76_1960004 [Gammaproteobacteria bacterium]
MSISLLTILALVGRRCSQVKRPPKMLKDIWPPTYKLLELISIMRDVLFTSNLDNRKS